MESKKELTEKRVKVYDEFFKTLPAIDFTGMKKKEMIVRVAEEVYFHAKKQQKSITAMSLKVLLAGAALQMGVPEYKAKHHSFIEDLFEQYCYNIRELRL